MAGQPTSKSVSPAGLAFLGVGTFLQAQGKYDALKKQSQAEEINAGFFREQADFAQEAGDRELMITHRQNQVLYGEQQSGFAKAGIDTSNSSFFMATQMLQGQEKEGAVKTETEMNVKLANARAIAADQAARDYAGAAGTEQMGTYIQGAATIAMFL